MTKDELSLANKLGEKIYMYNDILDNINIRDPRIEENGISVFDGKGWILLDMPEFATEIRNRLQSKIRYKIAKAKNKLKNI